MTTKSSLMLLNFMLCIIGTSAIAETTIINNYPPNNSNQQTNNCQSQDNGPGKPPGTYYQSNPHGGTDTVYSTGEKEPYIVDNCNNNPAVVQPYVFTPGVLPGRK